jgi:pSer/pThr/pTyr-binding forkhead associated (FHA) protein
MRISRTYLPLQKAADTAGMTTLAPTHPFGFADNDETVSDMPTQAGALPRISQRDRQRAALTAEQLAPGRYLAIEDGGEVVVIAVGEGSLRFGRGIASDVVLEDRSVSRRHAVVTRTGEEVVLWDDRSLNGVQVNGERVKQAVLHHGDAIAMGEVQMRFVAVD